MRRLSLLSLLCVMVAASPVLAQAGGTGRIMGVVTDGGTARPLSGTSVMIVGTQRGVLTDAAGRFVLTGVPVGTHTVRASQIGYGSQEQSATVVADAAANVIFELQPQAVALDEVVAVGYGTMERRDVTGATSTIRATQIERQPVTDIARAIQGQAPGVTVQQGSWDPGAGARIRIRGNRSITAGNDPLIVLDGVPITGGLQDIDISNVQSVEVLKDASATAVYGSRGANGVVLITSKRGAAGRTSVTAESSVGMQQMTGASDMMNAQQWMEVRRQGWLRDLPGQPLPSDEVLAGNPVLAAGLRDGIDTNWLDLISRNARQQSHRAAIRGGTEATRFMVAPSFYEQQGVLQDREYRRYSVQMSLDQRVSSRFNIGVNGTISRSEQNPGANGTMFLAHRVSPLARPYDEEGRVLLDPMGDIQGSSPLAEFQNSVRETNRQRFLGSLFAEYTLMPGLSLQSRFSPDITSVQVGTFEGLQTRTGALDGRTTASTSHQETFYYVFDNVLQYSPNLGDDHMLNTTLLYSLEQNRQQGRGGTVAGLPFEQQMWYALHTADAVTGINSSLSEWGVQSFMGRVHYSLFRRYLMTVTGRMDGSSRLAEGNKYSFFPSVALGWNVSDEAFMQSVPALSLMKLRISYGVTGNDAIAPYQTQGALMRSAYSFADRGVIAYRTGSIPTPNLGWERTTTFNAGVDFGFANNRLSGSVELYQANTSDLLLQRQLPSSVGYTSFLDNIGRTRNRGVELNLSSINLDRGDFRWSTDANFAINRNRIVDLYGDQQDDVGSRWFIGHPINVHYDLEFAGIWQTGQEQEAARFGARPGDIRIVDQNGDGRIDAEDRVILGYATPRWTGGLTNTLSWGGVDLSAMFTAQQGETVLSGRLSRNMELMGRFSELNVNFWTPENSSNDFPRPSRGEIRHRSSLFYRDGSYVRLQNVTLGYQIPLVFAQRMGAEAARVYATAQNPWLWRASEFVYPDEAQGHSAHSDQPAFRTLLMGVSFTF
jgi:TonB-linked SusC/RagA family outer membrane protein